VPYRPEQPRTSPELLAARAQLTAYEAVPFPAYVGTGTRDEYVSFTKSTYVPWLTDAVQRWRSVMNAYRVAYDAATNADAKMAVIAELLDASERNTERVSTAPDVALPAEWRSDPEMVDVFHRGLRSRIAPLWLEPVVDTCVASAAELHVEGGVAKRCVDLAKGFADAKKPAAMATGDGKYAVPNNPWAATTHGDRCSFSGSVRLDGEALYRDAHDAAPVATASFDVEVERLELPATTGSRYRATLRWPVHGTVWIRGEAPLFEMPDAVSAVKALVWVDAGTAATGRASSPQSMTLTANACARGRCRALLSPKIAPSLETACDRVAMAGTAPPSPSPASAEWRVFADQAIAISATPGGPAAAAISGGSAVMVLEKKGDYAHVHGVGDPWTVDGWVAGKDFAPDSEGQVVGVIASEDGAPNRVVSEARVGAGALRKKTPFTLAADAMVFVSKRTEGSCFVRIPHLEPRVEDGAFVVDCAALEPVAAKRY
jgi:hypothetical protein